jgi:hypothetical protein
MVSGHCILSVWISDGQEKKQSGEKSQGHALRATIGDSTGFLTPVLSVLQGQ